MLKEFKLNSQSIRLACVQLPNLSSEDNHSHRYFLIHVRLLCYLEEINSSASEWHISEHLNYSRVTLDT